MSEYTEVEIPSPESLNILAALQQAVDQTLDRKKRLGQYAVMWQNGQVVKIPPEELPGLDAQPRDADREPSHA